MPHYHVYRPPEVDLLDKTDKEHDFVTSLPYLVLFSAVQSRVAR